MRGAMPERYAGLDAALLAAIRAGADTFGALLAHDTLLREATALASADRWGQKNGDRVIDRRLQALRKAGKLTFAERQWRVVAA